RGPPIFVAHAPAEQLGAADEGKGIADLSADEIRAVRGMRSEEALGLLSGGSAEVIHRDRFAPAVR
ncbi:MAG: hypothetical protein ACPG9N_02915, partial [Miltoncostaeaceae bacterium]